MFTFMRPEVGCDTHITGVDEIVAAPWQLDADGTLAIPDTPGLGLQLDPDAIARHGDAPLLDSA